MVNKRVLVTGAATGVGFAISEQLARQGMPVLLSDMDEKAAAAAADILQGQGLPVEYCRLDVTDEGDIARVAELLRQGEPELGVLVNNAGIQHVASLEEFPADTWRLIIDVLLTGPALLTAALLPLMRETGFGRVINLGSIHSLVASPYKSAYVAAKHGLLGLSKSLALETASCDITVNTICPAYVKTALVDKQIAAQAEAHGISEEEVIENIMLAPMPKKQFIHTDEIVAAVNYLLSPLASNITGQTVTLDGGWTAH